jgi:hypothetical protein
MGQLGWVGPFDGDTVAAGGLGKAVLGAGHTSPPGAWETHKTDCFQLVYVKAIQVSRRQGL